MGRWLSGLGSGEREDPAEGRGQELSSTIQRAALVDEVYPLIHVLPLA